MMDQSTLSDNVKTAYDEFYQQHDEAWRMLGAKFKSQHIIDVCKSRIFNKVLEVGAGDGSILTYLSDQNFAPEFQAVEISASGVDYIKSRQIKKLTAVMEFDGYHLPFDDNSFDLIILSHVLEHVEHERMLLREIKRVGQYCVIEVPIDYKTGVDKRLKHFLAYGHINIYTPTSLRYLLQTEGFEIENDLTSVISPEVTRFNRYVNQKMPKKLLQDLKISLEYSVKSSLSTLFGKNMQERFANAYTILLKKADKQIDIF